jgi:hypothetical protein
MLLVGGSTSAGHRAVLGTQRVGSKKSAESHGAENSHRIIQNVVTINWPASTPNSARLFGASTPM